MKKIQLDAENIDDTTDLSELKLKSTTLLKKLNLRC